MGGKRTWLDDGRRNGCAQWQGIRKGNGSCDHMGGRGSRSYVSISEISMVEHDEGKDRSNREQPNQRNRDQSLLPLEQQGLIRFSLPDFFRTQFRSCLFQFSIGD